MKIKSDLFEWTAGKVKGFSGKELLNQEKGTLKLVKVDSLSVYPEHIHPDKTEYAYVIQGNPEFIIDSVHHTSETGDFLVFPVNTKHSIQNNTSSECILLVGSVEN
ncbi:MAG: cupin domain-containing protein [Bacteroidetes bacterium]|nr:cupin domain-containing protein [Bacteroidota bacterium]HET6243712.1 cupin domain-containing protein [Bacteroidia bacterium]